MEPLFEVISGDEFRRESITTTTRSRKIVTEPRNQTTWFALPTHSGFCNVPIHDDVQLLLKPEQIPYRQKYPTRYVYEIQPGLFVCRDCYLVRADQE